MNVPNIQGARVDLEQLRGQSGVVSIGGVDSFEGAELVTNPKAFEGEDEVVGGAGGAGEDDGSEEESDEEPEVQNNPEADEVETILSELTLPELREEARLAGISTAGNKADLVERLGRR